MRSASARKISTFDRPSPGRGQRRPRQLQIVMAVGEIEIGVLQERRGRQNDIGEIGGIGLELLEHHGEQIFAPQPAPHSVLIRRDRRRDSSCRPPSPSPADRPAPFSALPSSAMLTMRASRPSGDRCCRSGRSSAASVELKSAATWKAAIRRRPRAMRRSAPASRAIVRTAMPPRSLALHAIVQPDRSRTRGGILARQLDDFFRVNARQRATRVRRTFAHSFAQLIEAVGVIARRNRRRTGPRR